MNLDVGGHRIENDAEGRVEGMADPLTLVVTESWTILDSVSTIAQPASTAWYSLLSDVPAEIAEPITMLMFTVRLVARAATQLSLALAIGMPLYAACIAVWR
jgi:hypothetical protein